MTPLRWHPAYIKLKEMLRDQEARGGRLPDFGCPNCHTTERSYDKPTENQTRNTESNEAK